MHSETFDQQISGIAALDHRISRSAYELVGDHRWISRDDAAEQLGVARSVAAFHLDKLVAAGLLTVRYERLSGRSGPGAGRPAKLYGRSNREFDVSLPPRRYDLAGSVLAGAITRAATDKIEVEHAVTVVAREAGERAAKSAAPNSTLPAGGALVDVLSRHGYEPHSDADEIALVNCPFHLLAEEHRELVCRMNLAFITGMLDGLDDQHVVARLAPAAGFCCVRLARAPENAPQ